MRHLVFAFLLLAPLPMLGQQSSEFGAASFVPPTGWAVDTRPAMQSFTRVRGADRCMLLISAQEPANGSLDAAFARVWTAAFNPANYNRADRPASVEQISPAGYRHAVGESALEDRAGRQLVVRLHVFPIGQNIQAVIYLGSSRAALDDCRDDWNRFFASLRFPSVEPVRSAVAGAGSAPSPAAPSRPVSGVASAPNATTDAGPQRFDNITFTPPAGWSVRRASGVVEMTPTDSKGMERLQVLLLPGRRSSAALAAEIDGGWAELRALLGGEQMRTVNGVPFEVEQPVRSFTGREWQRANGGIRRADGVYSGELYVFRAGDRVERAAVVSRDFRDGSGVMVTTRNNPGYSRAIRELLFRMAFANDPGRELARPRLTPGGIVGVWAGLSMSTGEIQTNFAIFFDNGLAYFGPKFPVEGLLEIDAAVEQPAQQRSWGTYSFTGDAGSMTMPYGSIPLRRTATGLEVTTNRTVHRFVRLAMPDGTLDGMWCLAGGQCLRLTSAGRFEDGGAVRAVEHSTYAFPSTPAGGQGRYTLRAHTLTLTYDSGPEVRVGFAGLPPDRRAPSPAEIRLGFEGDILVRR